MGWCDSGPRREGRASKHTALDWAQKYPRAVAKQPHCYPHPSTYQNMVREWSMLRRRAISTNFLYPYLHERRLGRPQRCHAASPSQVKTNQHARCAHGVYEQEMPAEASEQDNSSERQGWDACGRQQHHRDRLTSSRHTLPNSCAAPFVSRRQALTRMT